MRAGATIYAPASGAGRAAIGVVRVSGPGCGAAVAAIAGRPLPAARRACLRRLRDPASGETLDRGLVLWFPAPASYSGEDMAEFHLHGGRAVLDGLLAALGALAGLRPAEPGEFTERAFRNGKLDLTAAEAVADLIEAETAAQRRQALRQMGGGLARLYDRWRAGLARALAFAEARIDFADQDIPETLAAETKHNIEGLLAEITQHLADDRRGERLREGFHIAILGAPNVGKSSLLNRLARRDAAIVSASAGTTRDVIEVRLDLAGYPVIVADTAGLRAAPGDGVESEGVQRARARAETADLRIALFDVGSLDAPDDETLDIVGERKILVVNKWDLANPGDRPTIEGEPALAISCRTGAGLDRLLGTLEREVAAHLDLAEAPALTRARHRRALEDCREALNRYLAGAAAGTRGAELGAEDLRLAARALGRITGRVDVEDILDIVFREFCIGK